ncbi:MAG: potassium channel family protein, partial [Lachnospiraceae bacterium]|nr:potassium channel family protein [Lachnospiraceae bacterium]
YFLILILCVFFLIYLMLRIIGLPNNIIGSNEKDLRESLSAYLILLILYITDLFLLCVYIEHIWPGSFAYSSSIEKEISNWDLFYYTIMTFTTVGYGDISPLTRISQIFACLVALSNILCVGVFVGVIASCAKQLSDLKTPNKVKTDTDQMQISGSNQESTDIK